MTPTPTPAGGGKGGKGGKDPPKGKPEDKDKAAQDGKKVAAPDGKKDAAAKKREATPDVAPAPGARDRLSAAQGELDAMRLAQEAKKVRVLSITVTR